MEWKISMMRKPAQRLWIGALAISLLGATVARCVNFEDEKPATKTTSGHRLLSAVKRTSVDLRTKFKDWGIEIRQQGQRAACQVFSMVAVAEYMAAKQGTRLHLSEQFLMSAANHAAKTKTPEALHP